MYAHLECEAEGERFSAIYISVTQRPRLEEPEPVKTTTIGLTSSQVFSSSSFSLPR